jgi:hypothetical protein
MRLRPDSEAMKDQVVTRPYSWLNSANAPMPNAALIAVMVEIAKDAPAANTRPNRLAPMTTMVIANTTISGRPECSRHQQGRRTTCEQAEQPQAALDPVLPEAVKAIVPVCHQDGSHEQPARNGIASPSNPVTRVGRELPETGEIITEETEGRCQYHAHRHGKDEHRHVFRAKQSPNRQKKPPATRAAPIDKLPQPRRRSASETVSDVSRCSAVKSRLRRSRRLLRTPGRGEAL